MSSASASTPVPLALPPPEPPSLWRQRNFLLLWGGQGISILGTMLSAIARPFLVFQLGGGAREVGIVLALTSVPFLALSLPAGAWIDRWDRKRTMLLADLGRGLALLTLVGGILLGHGSLALVYAATLAEGTCAVFFSIAETASLPRVVDPRQLGAALNANQSLFSLGFLLGPPIGGLLFALHPLLPFGLDAASFAVSVATLYLITVPFQGDRAPSVGPRSQLAHEVAAGLRWLWREPASRALTLLNGIVSLALGASALVIIRLVARVLPTTLGPMLPTYTGVVLACGGVGGLLGTLAAAYLLKRVALPALLCAALWLQGMVFVLLIAAPGYVALAAAFVISYALWPTFNAALNGYRLARIPDALQGRVNAVYELMGYLASPLGAVLIGLLLARSGIVATALARGVVLLAAAAAISLAFRHWTAAPIPRDLGQ